MKTPRLASIAALLFAFAVLPAASAKPKAENSSVTIKRQIEPRYPSMAYTHGISSGFAKIAFYVDEHGEASDFFPIEFSHEMFADELMSTVLKWDFTPAKNNGAAVKSVCHAYWEFLPDRAIETNALFDTSKRIDGKGSNSFRQLKYREDSELDTKTGMLAFPGLIINRGSDIIDQDRETVRARINFFVDQQGRVILPHILDSSDPQVNERLETALKNAAFSIPTYQGEPTIALVERTYDFPIAWVDQEPAKGL